jgi:hypothetical protein
MGDNDLSTLAKRLRPFLVAVGYAAAAHTDHGGLTGLADDDHGQYASANGLGTRSAYQAERLNKTLTAGDGLSGGGLLTADRTLALQTPGTLAHGSANSAAGNHTHGITASDDPQETASLLKTSAGGQLTLQQLIMRGDLLPFLPDGSDIGSTLYPFNEAHISAMYGTRFVEETIQVAGGTWIIPKLTATLADSLTNVSDFLVTTEPVDFAANDILILKDIGKSEYMRVISEYITYSDKMHWLVERHVDGGSIEPWDAGQAVADIGYGNDEGYLVASGGDEASFSVWRTGTGYANRREVARLGNLNGYVGVTADRWGLGVGQSADNEYMRYTPEDGLLIRGTIQADDGYLQNLTVQGLLSLNTSGELRAGNTTNGLRFGYLTDGYYLRGVGGGATQFELRASNGKAYAGGGNVILDADGVHVLTAANFDERNSFSIFDTGLDSEIGGLWGRFDAGGPASEVYLESRAYKALSVDFSRVLIAASVFTAGGVLEGQAAIELLTGLSPRIELLPGNGDIFYVGGGKVTWDGYFSSDGGIYSGRDADPGDGNVAYTGALKSYKNATEYAVYGFVPLAAPLTSTSWDGDARSTTGKTKIDLSAVFGAPAGVKAVLCDVAIRDSGSAAGDCYLVLSPNATSGSGLLTDCSGQANDSWERDSLIVPCDANGDIYFQNAASDASTMDVYLTIWGYWI